MSTTDLWTVFLRYLPLWVVAFATTWLTRMSSESLPPVAQLFTSAPTGLLAGVAFIWACSRPRRVAIDLFEGVREARRN